MNVRRIITLASVALALWVAGPAHAQTSPKVKGIDAPKSVLYVGNSFFFFNDSMHRFVGGLLAAAEPQSRGQHRATSVTTSGSGLNWHDMEAYFNPGMASYSFTADIKVDKPIDEPTRQGLTRALADHLALVFRDRSLTPAQYLYDRGWRKGDVLVIDDRATMHRAHGDYDRSRSRVLWRIIVEGDRPRLV